MPIDTPLIYALVHELRENLIGARVDKIFMPERDTVMLQVRGASGGKRLLLSCSGIMPRILFTEYARENPDKPPMFCMLLRKYLQNGRITEVSQPVFDRLVVLEIESYNELGDLSKKKLVLELTGRQSNLLLLNEEDRIIDSIHKIEFLEGKRTILPGVRYEYPDNGEKLNPLTQWDEIKKILHNETSEDKTDKILMKNIAGLSPLISREISFRALGECDISWQDLNQNQKESVIKETENLFDNIRDKSTSPYLYTKEDGSPAELSFTSIRQYGEKFAERDVGTFSELVDEYFRTRDLAERHRQRSSDIKKRVQTLVERTSKKLHSQEKELADCKDREELRIFGELLTANIAIVPKGAPSVTLPNYYEEMKEVKIPLDVTRSPQQNAQSYFKKYQKAKTAEQMLAVQMEKGREELQYFESVLDSLDRAECENDVLEIRAELASLGYMKKIAAGKGGKKQKPARGFALFESSDGFVILAGHNNAQNDELSHRVAEKNDLWLHTENIPGSHVVVVAEGREIPDSTITEAAIIAATMSKAASSSKVPVQYTPVKFLKKPAGAKPGFVTFSTYQTAFVDPDETLLEKLRKS